MSERLRAAAAILRDGHILMVFHRIGDWEFWTLPGGGVALGETPEEAAIREVMEETNLTVRIAKLLFERNDSDGREYVYLAEVVGAAEPSVGFDPELPPGQVQWIQKVDWLSLKDMKDDRQVSLVIKALENNS